MQTFGEDAGDHWVVNGQKIWTSYADQADWIFCLVRTDKQDKYQGITFMLFDMSTEGVSTKPIKLDQRQLALLRDLLRQCEGAQGYGEVPVSAPINRGWDVAKYLLGHEREMISGARAATAPWRLALR